MNLVTTKMGDHFWTKGTASQPKAWILGREKLSE